MDHVSSSLASTARTNSTTRKQCSVCKLGPSGLVRPLISCATCHRHWHSYCHNPPISFLSRTNKPWHCVRCSKKMIFGFEVKCAGAHCTKKIPAEGVDSKVYCFLCEKRKRHEEAKRVIPKPDTYAFPALSRAISPPMRREGSSKRGYSPPPDTTSDAKRPRLMRSLPQASPTRKPSEARLLVTSDEIHSSNAFVGPSEQLCSIPNHRAPFTASRKELSSFDKDSPLREPLSTRGGSVTASSNELSTLDELEIFVPVPFGSRNIEESLKECTPKPPARTQEPVSANIEDEYTEEQLHILDKDDNKQQGTFNIPSQDIGEEQQALTVLDDSKEHSIVPELGTRKNILPDTILNNKPPDSPSKDTSASAFEVPDMRWHVSNRPDDGRFGHEERSRGYLTSVAKSSSFTLNEGIRRLSISSEIVEDEDEVHDAERKVPQNTASVLESARAKSNMIDSFTQMDIAVSVDSHSNLLPCLVDKGPEGPDALVEENLEVFDELVSTVSSRSAALDALLYNQSALSPNVQFSKIDPRKFESRINRVPATAQSYSLSRSRLKEDYHGERLTSPDIEAKETRGWSKHQETNKPSIPPLEAQALLQDFGLPENLEPILRDGELVMSEVIPSRRKSRNAARKVWRIPK